MRAGITMVLLSLIASPALHAQVQISDVRTVLSEIDLGLVVRASKASPTERPQLERAKKAVEWLQGRVDQTQPKDITPEYLRSLRRAAELTTSASPDQLEDLASELEAKVDHCRALGISMGGSVLLKINTRTAAGPASNWQVVYLLKIYEGVPNASATNFPRLSTPTEAAIEPGRYWVWARNPSTGRTSDRVLVRAAGQQELLVDLPVP